MSKLLILNGLSGNFKSSIVSTILSTTDKKVSYVGNPNKDLYRVFNENGIDAHLGSFEFLISKLSQLYTMTPEDKDSILILEKSMIEAVMFNKFNGENKLYYNFPTTILTWEQMMGILKMESIDLSKKFDSVKRIMITVSDQKYIWNLLSDPESFRSDTFEDEYKYIMLQSEFAVRYKEAYPEEEYSHYNYDNFYPGRANLTDCLAEIMKFIDE